jgi:hypothetical protein
MGGQPLHKGSGIGKALQCQRGLVCLVWTSECQCWNLGQGGGHGDRNRQGSIPAIMAWDSLIAR